MIAAASTKRTTLINVELAAPVRVTSVRDEHDPEAGERQHRPGHEARVSLARNDIAGRSAGAPARVGPGGRSTGRLPASLTARSPLAPGGSCSRGRRSGDEPVADPANRHEVDRVVRIRLDLLAQAAHRDPDVGRVGIVRVAPAAVE